MSRRPALLARARTVLAVLGAARAAATAAETGRRPPAAALRTLGIEPSAWPKPS